MSVTMSVTTKRFEDWEAEQMQDPTFRAAAEEAEYLFQLIDLRLRRGLTQKALAERVGTTQSSIARLESGSTQPSLSFLRRVATALDARVIVRIEPQEVLAAEPALPPAVSVPSL